MVSSSWNGGVGTVECEAADAMLPHCEYEETWIFNKWRANSKI